MSDTITITLNLDPERYALLKNGVLMTRKELAKYVKQSKLRLGGLKHGVRNKSDFYQTPYSITQQLLDREVFLGTILEPACGHGAITRVLCKNGLETVGYDLAQGVDFLKETRRYPNIITNPPFSKAGAFVQKAKQVASDKICFLMPLTYLHGRKRYEQIWNDTAFRLARVYVFTRYPLLLEESPREDGCYPTGMMVYAWYVWQRSYAGAPEIRWIDNNDYVL